MDKAITGSKTKDRIMLQVSHMLITYGSPHKKPKLMQMIEIYVPEGSDLEAIKKRYEYFLKPIKVAEKEEDRFYDFESSISVEFA
jgi:hypothetical protein